MIFHGFQACPLCRFDVVLGSSYGFPECFGEASGAQEVALEAPRGAREERFHAQMAPGTSPKLKISVLEASWLQPMRPNVTNSNVFVILQKFSFFFRMAPVGFQEGPGRAPKVVGAPQLGPREPSGKLIRSIGALFWRSWICNW